MSMNVEFAHNALDIVINENTKIGSGTVIQHHATIGSNTYGTLEISGDIYWCSRDSNR